MTSPFYSRTLLFTLPQEVNALSIFGNDKKYICSPRGECRLASFSYFYLVIVLPPVNIINLVGACLRTHRGRQAVQYVYEWKHLYHGWKVTTRQKYSQPASYICRHSATLASRSRQGACRPIKGLNFQ